MKILIAEDEAEILELIRFTLELDYEKAEIFTAVDGVAAINVLENNPDVELIICDYTMPRKNGGEVYQYVKSSNLASKFVLCSAYDIATLDNIDEDGLFYIIEKPDITSGIEVVIEMLCGDQIIEPSSLEYAPISIDLLRSIRVCPADIFIKINDEKFIKLHQSDDLFSDEEVEKYAHKDLKFLYIQANAHKSAIESIQKYINAFFNEKLKSSSVVNKVKSLNEMIFHLAKSFGLNEELIEAVEISMQEAIRIIGNNDFLAGKIKELFKDESDYVPLHSTLLCIINGSIAMELNWGSEVTVSKLVFASLIHDLELENAKFVEYGNLENTDESFQEHSTVLAEKIREMENIPPDIDRIILEHHELPDGNGFPVGKNHGLLSPLSSLFIFSHKITDFIIDAQKHGIKITQDEIVQKLIEAEYDKGNFKKLITALEKVKLF